jgi:cell division protease FtsH
VGNVNTQKSDNFITLLKSYLAAIITGLKGLLEKLGGRFNQDSDDPDKPPLAKAGRWVLIFIVVFLALSFFNQAAELSHEEIPYSEFLKRVNDNQVEQVVVTEKYLVGKLKNGEPFMTYPLWNAELAEKLEQKEVEYLVRNQQSWLGNLIFNWLIPIGILLMLWSWLMRRSMGAGPGAGFLSLGNKKRIQPETIGQVTFDDVAGADSAKQELRETIEFLKQPEKIQKLGGRMPRGVLLVGPPGTGKTLLARAVSGEAQVPFFNISGSEFIELFVGVGAARVRELFEQARQKAPCIIFIDELDAVGRSRGGPVSMGGHDEREQTLNQLLTEMDGFDPSSGVVVMAATNRPEVLDKALLRAGRFDRQIVVDKPDRQDRVEILQIHCAKLTLADDIDLDVIARRTPGLVGADLANIANEAAILATRFNQEKITMANFEAAIDRVLTGPEKKNRALSPDEKRRVAYHEAGHALVAEKVPTGQPVHKISIIPRGVSALGYTLQLPVEEKFLSTEQELKDQLAILLAGRAAESLVLGSISTGAQNDLERATEIARNMVCYLGMSQDMGAVVYGHKQHLQFLPSEDSEQRNYSESTAQKLDAEIRSLMDEAQKTADDVLTHHREALDKIAGVLQDKEVMDRDELVELL